MNERNVNETREIVATGRTYDGHTYATYVNDMVKYRVLEYKEDKSGPNLIKLIHLLEKDMGIKSIEATSINKITIILTSNKKILIDESEDLILVSNSDGDLMEVK